MAQQCPLIFRQIDATVTRINTLFVLLGMVGYFMIQNPVILFFLATDLILRLSGCKRWSPIGMISLWIQKRFRFRSEMVDAGGKRLAAIFALGFVLVILLSHFAHLEILKTAMFLIYTACALLDLLFGYCIACKLYSCSIRFIGKRGN